MACCTKITKKNRKTITSESESLVSGYVEGQDGYVWVKYIGTLTVKVTGCKTKHRYLFEQDVRRLIDAGDADCLFDLMSGSFVAEVELAPTESNNGEVEREPGQSTETYGGRNDALYESSEQGVQGNDENLEAVTPTEI